MDDAPVGLDVDLKDFAVLCSREGLKRQATARAELLLGGQVEDLFDDRQVRVVAAWGTGLAALLAARFLGPGVIWKCDFARASTRFALFPEELLLAKAKLGFEFGVALFQFGDAPFGRGVHRLPVGGAAEGLEAFGSMRTNRARPIVGL
jgi:hypothetical protein